MAETEPITAGKFITGVVQPKTGLKALAFLPWLILFVLIGYCVYRTFNPKSTQQIHVDQGGSVIIKNEAQNKRKYTIFTEPYVGVETKDRAYIGIRIGGRWEF
jgi:hypothetical protein